MRAPDKILSSILIVVLVMLVFLAASMGWISTMPEGSDRDLAFLSVMAVFFVVLFGTMHFGMPRYRYRYLKGRGIQGTASAMAWPATEGSTSGVRGPCTLRVTLPGQEAYLVESTFLIKARHLAAFRSRPLPVWVDPKDPNRVFIDWKQVPTIDELVREEHEAMLRGERVE